MVGYKSEVSLVLLRSLTLIAMGPTTPSFPSPAATTAFPFQLDVHGARCMCRALGLVCCLPRRCRGWGLDSGKSAASALAPSSTVSLLWL